MQERTLTRSASRGLRARAPVTFRQTDRAVLQPGCRRERRRGSRALFLCHVGSAEQRAGGESPALLSPARLRPVPSVAPTALGSSDTGAAGWRRAPLLTQAPTTFSASSFSDLHLQQLQRLYRNCSEFTPT